LLLNSWSLPAARPVLLVLLPCCSLTAAEVKEGPTLTPLREDVENTGMASPQNSMRFMAVVVTVIILVCGLGSAVIVAVTGVTLAPNARRADDARQSAARVFSTLAKNWSKDSLARTSASPDDAGLLEAVRRAEEELGPLLGAPRIRLVKGPAVSGQKEQAEVLIRGVFKRKEGMMEMAMSRPVGGAWKIDFLGEPQDPDDQN
jgi:hypothetical protein